MIDDGTVALRRLPTAHLVRLLGDWRGGGSAYLELAASLRGLTVEGRLPPHTRLPSERALASALGVSRNTATAAIDVLREQGYVASRSGRGSWITRPSGPELRPDEPAPPAGDVIDMTLANLPAPTELAALAQRASELVASELGGTGYEPYGLPAARAAVARWLTGTGLPTSPQQILITQGALHALDLALRTLARPGDRILVENPAYPGALDAIRAHGCVPVPVPVTADGWDLSLMRAALRDTRPRLGYLIPDFHNPTGASAPDGQRAEVARAARTAGTVLVSDESLVDLWIESRERPRSLAAGLAGGAVLVVGSLSKLVWGGLRIGWVRAHPELVQRFALARGSQDVGSPILEQLLAAEVIERLDALLPARRALLAERRDALLAALAAIRPEWRAQPPSGGMAVWAQLPPQTPSSALARRALDHGVRIAAGGRFGADGGFERRVRLPFTQPPELLLEAVRRLAAAEAGLARRRPAAQQLERWVA